MQSIVHHGTLRLRDGRLLSYARYGDPEGRPGFFFHGFPGSRLEAGPGAEAAARLGLRIFALERPGFGLSDFKPGRSILDWPDDVVEAADQLGIDRFPIMGLSGGGPYAAACAYKIPDRLTGMALVSSVAPFGASGTTDGMSRLYRFTFGLAGRLTWTTGPAMWWMGRQVRRNPDRVLDRTSAGLPEFDREIMARPEVRSMLREDLMEAFRQGSRGAAWELALLARPWGFRLEDIAMEVHLWQGEADVNVPVAMGRYLAGAIPNCRARFYPGEGHLLAVHRMEEIQAVLFP